MYDVYTMRIDTIHKTVNGKTYTSHLLRHAYRDHGQVRHRTIANLTGYPEVEIAAIRLGSNTKATSPNWPASAKTSS